MSAPDLKFYRMRAGDGAESPAERPEGRAPALPVHQLRGHVHDPMAFVGGDAQRESHHFSRATILLTRFVPEESFISIVKRLNISTNPRKSVLA